MNENGPSDNIYINTPIAPPRDINKCAVRVQNKLQIWFKTSKGKGQFDPISPELFITILEKAMAGAQLRGGWA